LNLNDREFEVYRQAVEEGGAESYFNLGAMYASRGSDFYHESVMWYRTAANQGHIEAQKVLDTIKENKRSHAPWYKKLLLGLDLNKYFN
jgi:TPR repeat protein